MGDPLPVRVAGPRTVVRHCPSTRIPLPSHAAAAACLSTSGPPAFRHPPYRALSSSRTRQGSLLVPHDTSRHDLVPPRRSSRQARGPSRALAALLAVGGTPPPRARPRMWRTVPCDASSTAYAAALQHGTRAALIAAFTRRALRPGNVACGDRCVRGTLPPRHHASTKDLLSTTLGATGPKADLGPRHYRSRPTGGRPRKALSAASDRRCGSDGALRLGLRARRATPRRASSSRRRGSPRCRADRASPIPKRSWTHSAITGMTTRTAGLTAYPPISATSLMLIVVATLSSIGVGFVRDFAGLRALLPCPCGSASPLAETPDRQSSGDRSPNSVPRDTCFGSVSSRPE